MRRELYLICSYCFKYCIQYKKACLVSMPLTYQYKRVYRRG